MQAEELLYQQTYNTQVIITDHMEKVGGLGGWRKPRVETVIKNLKYDRVFYVPGGADICPAIYGQKIHPTTQVSSYMPNSTIYEAVLVRHLVDIGHPVLAICRGHQLVHAATGGDLVQDLSLLDASNHYQIVHVASEPGLFQDIVDSVKPPERWGPSTMVLNHTHHQAVIRVGNGFKAVATTPDGVVEAAEHLRNPVLTIQFHPEYSDHPWSQWFIHTVLEYLGKFLPEEVSR